MAKFELYTGEQLPPGFVYPDEIRDFAAIALGLGFRTVGDE